LLRRVQAEERRERRGRLKVFLGYASHVGKSFRMLDEGRRRKERGQDVVVAATQSKVSPDVEALVQQLEVVPMRTEFHDGRSYESLDLPALLARRPAICLIDELANDNPPGSSHPRRWQDVEDLLQAGISVISAVNLQYVEDQQDAVERITGKRTQQVIPGDFLREADEIVMVDVPSEALATTHGEAAAENVRRVTELRELALLLAAGVVEKQLHDYLESHGLPQAWGAHERILVCLTPRSDAAQMLERARSNADRFHGDLLACYVEQAGLSAGDQEAIEANLEAARQYGAEVHRLPGSDFVNTILDFAREQRVTQIFVGHTGAASRRFFGGPIDRLIARAAEFDVRLFPQREKRA